MSLDPQLTKGEAAPESAVVGRSDSQEYRTRRMLWHYMRSKPSHVVATASAPYPCDHLLSWHSPRRVMAYNGLGSVAEYDVLDYNLERPLFGAQR